MVLVGAVWTFQGLGYLEGSAMSDQTLWAILGPLAAAAIGMGVAPNLFLKPMEPAVQLIVDRVQSRKPIEDVRAEAVLPRSVRPKPRIPGVPAPSPKPQVPSPVALRVSEEAR